MHINFLHSVTDLENWNGTDRHHFNAIVSDQDLIEVVWHFGPHLQHHHKITLSLHSTCLTDLPPSVRGLRAGGQGGQCYVQLQ